MTQDPKQGPPPLLPPVTPSQPTPAAPPQPGSTQADPTPPPPPPPTPPPPPFDPSRMIGIIKRKALIKELAALYHAECLTYCQELLELQKKWDEPFIDLKAPDISRKEAMRPPKRLKKAR